MFGDKKTSGRLVRNMAEEDEGGAALETALLLGLTAVLAFTMKHMVLDPVLGVFTKAAQTINQALAG